jgi:Mg2+-importing ATPase
VYVLGIAVALSLGVLRGRGSTAIVVVSAIFTALSAGLALLMFFLPGRKSHPLSRRLGKVPMIHGIVQHLESADVRLVRNPGVLTIAAMWQIAIVALDTFTLVLLIESLGTPARIAGAFATFMIASLIRSMGFVPGGLGTFEAASVLTLRLTGARFSVALGATLMFRALSFWLPMIPGLWYSRQLAPSVKIQK